MNRDDVWQAIDDERAGLADLLDDLSPDEWETPSLCAGWRVREVAAHLTQAHASVGAAAMGFVRARGSFNGMIRDVAIRQAKLPVERFPVLLRGMVGSRKKAPFVSDLEPLIDILVHGQDIAIPLGRDRPVPARAAATAATRSWSMGWPFHAKRKLRGLRLVATDRAWSAGEGVAIEGPVAALLLLVTGRSTAALPRLSGPGVAELETRLAAAAP
jgi:uncharacterized protein (TIGR03083 family)